MMIPPIPPFRAPEPPVQAPDILVDGFIARTFSTEDAQTYFTSFFQTQDFLQDYGISYSRGAWRITENQDAPFARWPSSRAPIQDPSQPVDFDVRETQGTVVPQRRRTVAARVTYRRHVQLEDDVLQLPIFFVHQNGGVGFSLSDILQGRDGGLHNGDKEASLGGLTATFMRISWPGHADWKQQIQTQDRTYVRNPITISRFMKTVGRSVEKFLNTPMANGHVVDPRCGNGVHGISQNDVKIIGAVHVSPGNWMPIIQLISSVL